MFGDGTRGQFELRISIVSLIGQDGPLAAAGE